MSDDSEMKTPSVLVWIGEIGRRMKELRKDLCKLARVRGICHQLTSKNRK